MKFKKFTAVILIIMLLIAPIKKADAIVPALGPAVYYGLGSLIVASGVYAATNDDVQYLVEDYWNQASDSIKNLWKNTAIYAGTAGYLLVNQSMISDMTKYLIETKGFVPGANSITSPPVPVINGGHYKTIQHSTYGTISFNVFYHPSYGKYAIQFYSSTAGIMGITNFYSSQALCESAVDSAYFTIINNELYAVYLNPTNIEQWYQDKKNWITGVISGIDWNGIYGYLGDAAGIGTALDPEAEFKVPCPPVPEIDWPETWLDDLEKALNEADNPFVDDETTIQEGKEEWDWWIDEWGNPYKVRKGEPPRDPQKDKKIGFPIPMPEPNIPDEFPDLNNPEETVIENPPETTSTQNPDGTRTDTTTQTTTTTRRWYDPDTEKWKETTTTTTTTTQQDYDPDGLPIGPPRTVVTTPDGPVKTTDPEKDADRINWDPLKLPLLGLTTKFPFSLPWDLMRGIESLQAEQWDRKFIIPALGPNGLWPEMEIDLSMYDGIAEMTRIVLLIIFDFGLIMATRKLMGGDV